MTQDSEETTPNLGDKVKDRMTGFEGLVVGMTCWVTGCDRASVVPQTLDKDGQPQKSVTFDITQLEVLQKRAYFSDHPRVKNPPKVVTLPAEPAAPAPAVPQRPGGPRDDVSRRPDVAPRE